MGTYREFLPAPLLAKVMKTSLIPLLKFSLFLVCLFDLYHHTTNLQGRMVRFSNPLASDIHRYVSWENLTRDQVAVELQVVVLVGKLSRSRELGELTPHHGPILLPPG